MKNSKQNPHLPPARSYGATGNPLPPGEQVAKRRVRALLALVGALTSVFEITSCETGNYIPPVTPKMAAISHGKQRADVSTLERGRRLFAHRCIECHILQPMWKYSREDWPHIVDDMSHRASLTPNDRDAVIAYILAVRSQK